MPAALDNPCVASSTCGSLTIHRRGANAQSKCPVMYMSHLYRSTMDLKNVYPTVSWDKKHLCLMGCLSTGVRLAVSRKTQSGVNLDNCGIRIRVHLLPQKQFNLRKKFIVSKHSGFMYEQNAEYQFTRVNVIIGPGPLKFSFSALYTVYQNS